MPKSFARRTYDQWVARNRHRFRYPPSVVCARKRSFDLAFEGIAPELRCLVTNCEMAMICIQDGHGENWDILMDFDVFPARTASGQYFCSQCKTPAHYLSRAALWEDHVFEPLLRWVNGLPPDGWICLRGGADLGATATFLKSDPGEIERFEKRFPLVVGNRPMAQILEGDRPVVCGKTVDTTRRDTVCRTSAPYCLKDVRGTPNATRHH